MHAYLLDPDLRDSKIFNVKMKSEIMYNREGKIKLTRYTCMTNISAWFADYISWNVEESSTSLNLDIQER